MKSKLTSTTIRIMSILSLILTISAHLQSFATPTSSSVNCSLEHSNIHPTSSHLIIPVNSALEIKDDIHPIQCITEDRNFLARYKYGNRRNKKNGMTIMHWNKGPSLLQNKMHDIENIIDKYKPHILGLSEANLRNFDDISEVQIKDYNLHVCPTINNLNHRVSRVVVFTHRSVVVKPRLDLMNPLVSTVWLEVGLPRQRKFLVCNAYREWGYPNQPDKSSHSYSSQKDRWSLFLDQWETGILEDKEIIVLGDINICHNKWNRVDLSSNEQTYKLKSLIVELFERIIPQGFCQLVRGSSYVKQGQEKSGLDHLYSNKVDKLSEVALHTNAGSDHKMIHEVRYSRSMRREVRYVKKRVFKDFNEDAFRADVKLIDWWSSVYSSNDANEAADNLSAQLSKALDRWAPVRKVQVKPMYRPWISRETKALMNQRDYAQELASNTNNPDDWRKFKSIRNTVVSRTRVEKSSWEKSQLDHLSNDPTNLWRNVKSWLGWKNSGPPTQLFVEKLISKPKEIANTMNTFFVTKVKKLQEKLPDKTGDPTRYLRNAMKNRQCNFKFKPVGPDEVRKIVKSLKNSKSTGLDNIDTRTIKLVIEEILPALTHVINLSLTNQEFPRIFKQSKIVPLLKKPKDDPLNPKFYRPVALLPIMSKILERAVFIQIEHYVEDNGLLHPSHHGGRACHSTTTAIIEMYDQWLEAVDKGNIAGCMMLDLSAAYDLANHQVILDKLKLYGFDELSIKWMKSYLSGRSQCVYVDGELSNMIEVDVGVPQGSVLGGLLYVLLVGDLPEVVHEHDDLDDEQLGGCNFNLNCDECGGLTAFVDDSTYSVSASSPDELSRKLSTQYRKLADYMGDTGLVINDEKTHLIVLGNRKDKEIRAEVKLDTGTVTVSPVATEKLLGLHVHESLKFGEHCRDNENSMFRKLNPRLNALKKLSKSASFKTRLMVANSSIMSLFCYMMPVWGGTEKYLIKAAQVIQNRAARTVTKLDRFTSQKVLLQQTNWLSINQMINYHTILSVWRVRKFRKPEYLSRKLNKGYMRTRSCENQETLNLFIPEMKTSLGSKGMMTRGPMMWNSLPAELKGMSGSLGSFKNALKTWIKNNVEP